MVKKKRIVLFGAGSFANHFLENNAHENIIAILDNDVRKHGTEIYSFTIMHPNAIKNLEFDELIITSSWSKTISEQLIKEYGIPANKITISLKTYNPPFMHLPTRELAKAIMLQLQGFLVKHNIQVFLDFGTLLGFYRDGVIIPWDADVDFTLNESELPKLFKWMPHFPTVLHINNTEIHITYGIHFNSVKLYFTYSAEKNPFNCVEFNLDLMYRFIDNKNLSYCGIPAWRAPRIHFDSYDYLTIDNERFHIPAKVEEYLEILYGDWRVPRKEFTLADWKNLD